MVLAGIQDQSFDSFRDTLDCAMQFDMPKLLACCEYHIAAGPHHKFHVASCLGHALPISSMFRIAEGLSACIEKMAACSVPSGKYCSCDCCMRSTAGVCICVPGCPNNSKECARVLRAKYVPGPMEFLQMVQH